MMSRVLRSLALCVVVLAGAALPQYAGAQDATVAAVRTEAQTTLPRSLNTKFPGIAGVGNQVVVAANSRSDATVWQKEDVANDFPNPVTVGDADGQADYTSAHISGNRGNNTFYAIWTNQSTNEVRFSSKPATGTSWAESRRIARVGFPHFARIAGFGDRLMAVWREVNPTNDGKIIFRYSTDNGQSWNGGRVSNRTTLTNADVAVNASGQFVVSFADTEGDAYLAIFNGSNGFNQETVQNDSNYYTQADVGIAPDGRVTVLLREEGRGVYLRDRQANGTWGTTVRLVAAGGRNVIRIGAALDVDLQGNTYVNWISTADGDEDVYFTFRPAGGTSFEAPVKQEGPGPLYNGSSTWTISGAKGYNHYVSEYFAGADLVTRYFRNSADVTPPCTATIAFANNATVTKDRNLSGTIAPTADCNQASGDLQYRIGLNSQADSLELRTWTQNVSNNFLLGVPSDIATQCTHTVNVRFYRGGNAISGWVSKEIKVDPQDLPNPISADVMLENYSLSKDIAANGPSDGDPRYTRKPQARLTIKDTGDCSGLNRFTTSDRSNTAITGGTFSDVISFSDPAPAAIPAEGPVQVPVTIVDNATNEVTFRPTIIYDPADLPANANRPTAVVGGGRPQWASGSTLTPSDNTLSILRTITFGGVKVTDNLYTNDTPNITVDDFWGVWVAAQYIGAPGTAVPAPDPDNPTLTWVPVRVASRTCTTANGCSFSVPVNLFTGLGFGPDTTRAGVYRVYTRVLDGAGNPSTRAEAAVFNLEPGYQLPGSVLNLVFK
jgi:hypothetical protein